MSECECYRENFDCGWLEVDSSCQIMTSHWQWRVNYTVPVPSGDDG